MHVPIVQARTMEKARLELPICQSLFAEKRGIEIELAGPRGVV